MSGRTLKDFLETRYIDSEILRHDARNLELKRRLAEHGIDFRGERQITCNFRAPDEGTASELEHRLFERGFLRVEISPAGSADLPTAGAQAAEVPAAGT